MRFHDIRPAQAGIWPGIDLMMFLPNGLHMLYHYISYTKIKIHLMNGIKHNTYVYRGDARRASLQVDDTLHFQS